LSALERDAPHGCAPTEELRASDTEGDKAVGVSDVADDVTVAIEETARRRDRGYDVRVETQVNPKCRDVGCVVDLTAIDVWAQFVIVPVPVVRLFSGPPGVGVGRVGVGVWVTVGLGTEKVGVTVTHNPPDSSQRAEGTAIQPVQSPGTCDCRHELGLRLHWQQVSADPAAEMSTTTTTASAPSLNRWTRCIWRGESSE
jgi:hypothetical protein